MMVATIEELEREVEQFHKNVKESNRLMETLSSVIKALDEHACTVETSSSNISAKLEALSPDLRSMFDSRVAVLLDEARVLNESQRGAVASLVDSYFDKFEMSICAVTAVPGEIDARLAENQKTMEAILRGQVEGMDAVVSRATRLIEEVPKAVGERVSAINVEQQGFLSKITSDGATAMSAAIESMQVNARAVVEEIGEVPSRVESVFGSFGSSFMENLNESVDKRLESLASTEGRMEEMKVRLEEKYDAFIEKLELTNVDQLYKYCQEMNASLGRKVLVVVGISAVCAVVSIVTLLVNGGIA